METQSSNVSLNSVRHPNRSRWTVKEKKIVLTLLRKHGHQNLQPFLNSFPHRTESEIKRFLNKYKISADKRLRLKLDVNVEQTLAKGHPWMPFMNSYCSSDCSVHENLVAFTVPFMEHFLKHPNSMQGENVEFQLAYKALFNSLIGRQFPEDMNHETFAMLFASLTQLFDDIRIEQIDHRDILLKSVKRCLQKKANRAETDSSCPDTVIQLPEINILKFTSSELDEVCKK